ncbi:flagellin [Kineococcus aurantiacus]|uniref:Flagellin n=1 Tax=Kineococcus aurantiacus TaxID=37633 RepID=A0A7Y9J2S4_9ACTN|nr:flagellin [Kineococcus aurantiacus]NYD24577.1 flagellin [Kineococcus aurantiacus]
MGLRINTNTAALNSYRNLQATDKALNSSLEKLSSGLRINRAADDAAGLVVSEGLRAQIGGLSTAARNAQDGVNYVQIADGALSTVGDMLTRMRDLAVQASNVTADTDARTAANKEFEALRTQIDNIGSQTKFGGTGIFNGAAGATFQVGANQGETIVISSITLSNTAGGIAGGTLSSSSLTTMALASAAIGEINDAITKVASSRADLGAVQNRFQHVINNLNVSIENLSASQSAIRDTDMAQEMTKFTRSQILSQAGTSMLAQANSASQNVLSLLRG